MDVKALHYPALPAAARIHGDVVFEITASQHKLVSGHPLLTRAAEVNLARWSLPTLQEGKYLITYHFGFVDEAGTRRETVLIGNKLDRFFRRLVGAPTTKSIAVCYNDPATEPVSHYTVARNGADYAIDVFVTTRVTCLETQSSGIAVASSDL